MFSIRIMHTLVPPKISASRSRLEPAFNSLSYDGVKSGGWFFRARRPILDVSPPLWYGGASLSLEGALLASFMAFRTHC